MSCEARELGQKRLTPHAEPFFQIGLTPSAPHPSKFSKEHRIHPPEGEGTDLIEGGMLECRFTYSELFSTRQGVTAKARTAFSSARDSGSG